MITELRAAFFLAVSLVFFLLIVGVLALGMVMRPDRWNTRRKPVS